MSYIRRLRLEQAAYEFRLHRKSVGRTATGLGFATHESFTRRFHAAFGTSPKQYTLSAHQRHLGESGRLKSVAVDRFPGVNCLVTRIRGGYQFLTPPGSAGSPWEILAQTVGVLLNDARVECYGLCWDDPLATNEALIRYDACLSVSGAEFDSYRFETAHISGGRYVRAEWCGPIAEMTDAYHYLLYEWPKMHRSQVDPDRPPFERFVVRHDSDGLVETAQSCGEISAKIFVPLK